jgi:hypothetical protein
MVNNRHYYSDRYRSKFDLIDQLASCRRVTFDCIDYLRDVNPCDTVCKLLTWLCIFIAVAIILGVSIKAVESTEYGIQYDVYTKYLNDDPCSGCLIIGPPG